MSFDLAGSAADQKLGLDEFAAGLRQWLASPPDSVVEAASPHHSTDVYMAAMRALMADLYAAGWSRYGWPEDLGGLGGTILHRALMWDILARHGIRGMAAFEHLEVLGPTLVAFGHRDLVADVLPRCLDGTRTWAQGFSEPGAGSDLAALRTRAIPVAGGYQVSGRKIWTSWARFARWCLVLARTGTVESRHRGITALLLDLDSPGVDVRSISQANGHDELAEVTFDDVFVPEEQTLGGPEGGWNVAMHILSHERGSFAWFRQCFLKQVLADNVSGHGAEADGLLGDAVLDLAAVDAMSRAALRAEVSGSTPGPHAAFTKLSLCAAEQGLYNWLLAADPEMALDLSDNGVRERRAGYLFSRIVTVYGGSQQMQLDTVAKQVLGLPS